MHALRSRLKKALWLVLLIANPVLADTTPVDHANVDSPPTGPFAVVIEHDSDLATHTIYRPTELGAIKHPILVWGEGACADAGLQFPEYLREIASYGILVIADGPPMLYIRAQATARRAQTSPSGRPPAIEPDGTDLIAALDWAFSQNRNAASPYYQKLDTTEALASVPARRVMASRSL